MVHDLTKNVTELYKAYDYTPYGTVTATGIEQPIQWSSEHYDPELALVYYNYRHYNPADGRWINRNPIAEEGGMNLYGVVGNSIYNFLDVLGLQSAAKKKKEQAQIETKKKCTFQIVAGHTDKVLIENYQFMQRKNTKLITRCDRFYGIACYLTPNSGYLWPSQQAKDKALRNTNPKTTTILGITVAKTSTDDAILSDELISKITQAEQDAEQECTKADTCCSSIQVIVRCLSDRVMRQALNEDRIVRLGCRYKNTYKCKQDGKLAKWSARIFSEQIKE